MASGDSGTVVLARSDNGPVFATLIDSRAGRLTVVTPSGSRETWTESRVFLVTGVRVQHTPPQTAVAALAAFEASFRTLIDSADLAGAWELLSSETHVGLEDLADLLFGQEGPLQTAAAAWTVETEGIHFKLRPDGRCVPSSGAAVESLLRARAGEAREARKLALVTGAVQSALHCPEARAPGGSDLAVGIGWLSTLLYDGPGGKDGRRGMMLLEAIRGAVPAEPEMAAFDTLVRLGVCDADEIVSLRQNRITADFEPAVEQDAALIAASIGRPVSSGDLRFNAGEGPVAIDDETTKDVDDALMIRPVDSGFEVHILIADPASFIELDSPTGRAGLSRASSLYIPTGTYPMLPRSLSEGALSLSPERERPMLDFVVTLAPDGTEIDFSIRPVFGRIEARMTYDHVDALLSTGGEGDARLSALVNLAGVLRERRIEAGATMLERDEYQVKLKDGVPEVRRIPYSSLSRRMVAEFMILACALAGRFARTNGIPVVYRRQDPPERDSDQRLKGLQPGSRAWHYNMLRTLKKGELSTVPGFHHSLGVTGYTQVTSPLRRFQDLLAHMQIKGFLFGGRWPIDQDRLMNLFGELESRVEVVARVEREARRYWTMKFLQRFSGSQVEGEVVARIGARALVELDGTGLVLPVSAGGAMPGARIRLTVQEVDPRRDQAVLIPA